VGKTAFSPISMIRRPSVSIVFMWSPVLLSEIRVSCDYVAVIAGYHQMPVHI
jgi:hypothetical protein